ncbi:PREDICTED: uncharacterized protein LOC104609326 isoform X2 [Nelumbo nucifera]|uniref:Uncharacterized protein LOC104609326 isoform X2 n=1 Tax=Nelumbo nucifera TaxID=4432 RepID=A0A1U8BBL6_NELNU|nr:PREDICTED: uncharacterized protein LOC104609326 isoform X2 [Nelumbo nucifera]
MTLLRSREIIPKFSPKTLNARIIEPSTPIQLQEPSNVILPSPAMSSSTPPPTSFSERPEAFKPRRSLRLASKSKAAGNDEGSCKGHEKKNVTRENLGALSSKEDSLNSDVESLKGTSEDNQVPPVVYSSAADRVIDRENDELGTEIKENEGIKKHAVDLDAEEVTVTKEPASGSTSSGETEMASPDSESLRTKSQRTMKSARGNGKRKLDIDINLPALNPVEEDGDANWFTDLRSGARISKRRTEGTGIDYKITKNDGDHDGLVFQEKEARETGGGDEEKVGKITESGGVVDVGNLEADPIDDDNGLVNGQKRYSREEKGKAILIKDSFLSLGINPVNDDLDPECEELIEDAVRGLIQLHEAGKMELKKRATKMAVRNKAMRRRQNKERFHDTARANASKFAHFQPEVEESHSPSHSHEREMPSVETNQETEDWPGPFSTAMKIIKDRMKLNSQQENSLLVESKHAPVIKWMPSKTRGQKFPNPSVPSLQDLSLSILAKNSDAIVALEGVPDDIRHKLSELLCDSRRMDSRFMNLLVSGCPTEIRVKNCSWVTEEQLSRTFGICNTENLMVLQLDLCGRCISDYTLRATLAQSPNTLPALTTISLIGACRLSDVGLNALVASTPSLRSINLGQCSLLSSIGINALADSLRSVLRELYLDDCPNIDAMLILPALKKLECLELLSMSRVQTVCDGFVRELIAIHGPRIKELVFADCWKLTDNSLKVIAEACSGLCALNLANLHKLTDSAICYLANGCRSIQMLKLCRNAFSDEAVAAFLETSGGFLTDLSLNSVKKVGHNTAISLAKRSRKLQSLDLSWCRNLTDEALGLIVDSCISLKVLKLFGCTQITNLFLDGYSNPLVQIIGLKMTPILENVNMNEAYYAYTLDRNFHQKKTEIVTLS